MNKQQGIPFNNVTVLNMRIVFLSCALVNLLVTAVVTLGIDTTVDNDLRVQSYHHIRWKLITFWFNVITLAYLPTRLYADWLTRKGDGNSPLVTSLKHVTDVVMTSLLFPVTLYFDALFWYVYINYPDLIAPQRLFEVYMPYWAQHCLHSVSGVVVLMDLVLTPRERPHSLKLRVALLLVSMAVYWWIVYSSCLNGEIVYSICEHMTLFQYILVFGFSMACMLILFFAQWVAIDFLWRAHQKNKNI